MQGLACVSLHIPECVKVILLILYKSMSSCLSCWWYASQVTTVLPGVALLYLTYNMAKPWTIRWV